MLYCSCKCHWNIQLFKCSMLAASIEYYFSGCTGSILLLCATFVFHNTINSCWDFVLLQCMKYGSRISRRRNGFVLLFFLYYEITFMMVLLQSVSLTLVSSIIHELVKCFHSKSIVSLLVHYYLCVKREMWNRYSPQLQS